MDNPKDPNKKLGFWMSTSLVVGNMIGAGIFLMPSALAEFGGISLIGWVVTAAGALLLARVFSQLSRLVKGHSGGPYAFAQEGFGNLTGFLVAWGYWNSIWIANAAIVVAFTGAMADIFPLFKNKPGAALGLGLATLWGLTWVNALGLRSSGRVQVVTTLLKLVPLLGVILGGWYFFNPEHFVPFNASGQSDTHAIAAAGALTLYAFLGLESATVPADRIENPERTIPRATLMGTLLTTVIYILGTVVVMGIIPLDTLTSSSAPFADAMRQMAGAWGGVFVAAGMAVATFGALNGWILVQSQVGRATARDGLFPQIFSRENRNGVPIFGLVLGSTLSSILVLMNFTEGLVEQFSFMILLSTLCTLVPYLVSAGAYLLLSRKAKRTSPGVWLLGGLALAFSAWALFGIGNKAFFWGLALLALGLPVYALMKSRQKHPTQ